LVEIVLADEPAGTARGAEEDVEVVGKVEVAEADGVAMAEAEIGAWTQVGADVGSEHIGRHVVRHEADDDFCGGDSGADVEDFEVVGLCNGS
jgi:hypothetical protein